MSDALQPLREHLTWCLEWGEAHVTFEKAIDGIPADRRGERPAGFEHSAWDLLEHLRLAQQDLVDFCVKADYVHAWKWPDDYWPRTRRPSDADWNASVGAYLADRARLQAFIRTPSHDLYQLVPTGKGNQTYLRSILLVIDHNSYHVAQVIDVRRAMGLWP
jgi:hypothetical protein